MKRNVIIGLAAGALALILGWYFLIYSPKDDDLTKAKAEVTTAQTETSRLQAQLSQLRAQQKNAVAQQALLGKLDAAIPAQADLAEFIIEARQIADSAGIDFLSIAPSPPAASGSMSTIALSISIEGSFFQVQNYLNELETMGRLVIIDTMNISAASDSSDGSGSGGTTLSVSLTGRMFTRSQGAAAPGTTPTPDSSTTTTLVPTGGESTTSSTPASSVPDGSSTTGGT